MLYQTLSHTLKLAPHERPSSQPLTKNPQQLCYFLYQTLTKDPQQVWQTLNNFDYPELRTNKVVLLYIFASCFATNSFSSQAKGFAPNEDKSFSPGISAIQTLLCKVVVWCNVLILMVKIQEFCPGCTCCVDF